MSSEIIYHTISAKLIILTNNHDAKPDKDNFTHLIGQLGERLNDLSLKSVRLTSPFTTYKLDKSKFVSNDDSADVASDLRSKYELTLRFQVSKDEIDKLDSIMWMICNRKNFKHYDFMCQFDRDFDSFYMRPAGAHIPLEVKQFDFGNMINFNRFVSNGQYFLLPEKRQCYSIQNRSAEILPEKKVLNLRFEIDFLEDSSRRPTVQTFRMEFPYESITEVNVCIEENVDLYFFIKYPPKIYLKVTVNSKAGLKIAEGRWISLKPINTENFGRCKVFKMKVNKVNFQTTVAALRDITTAPVSFTPIHVYSIEHDHFSDSFALPFNVNYALDCILHLTTAFHDELFIRGKTEEIIEQFIHNECLEGREEAMVEALYRLFDYYSSHRVHDAVEKFNEIYGQINSKGKKGPYVSDIHVRKVIWTSTHTRFLPPSEVATDIILEDVEPEDLLQVFVFDEDLTPLSGDGLGETNIIHDYEIDSVNRIFNRIDHLKHIIDSRLPIEGSYNVSGRSYRYTGGGNWPILDELNRTGIILKANIPLKGD